MLFYVVTTVVFVAWLGLSKKNIWLGSGKYHVFHPNAWFGATTQAGNDKNILSIDRNDLFSGFSLGNCWC